MTHPLVSIIIPIYNAEKYIHECLSSVINQTYKNLEIILVDDGSPDNCGAICDQYAKKDSRIVVIHKENGGVSSARNAGLEIAKGEYIQFVDADDYIEPNMSEILLKTMTRNNPNMVICSFRRVHKKRQIHNVIFENTIYQNLYEIENKFAYYLDKMAFQSLWNKLYKRKYCGRFDVNFTIGEDFLFNLDYISNHQKIEIINDILYNYRFV